MTNEKIGTFIAERRKSKGLTQKELAESVNVTDKAVSKWERGLSCPDISILTALSDVLGISVAELLNGEKNSAEQIAEADSAVHSSLQYAEQSIKTRLGKIRAITGTTVSLLFITAIITCLICNLAISGGITWAWFPISSVIFVWLAALPIMLLGRRGIALSLAVLSLLTIPYLYALEKIIGVPGLIMPIGIKSAIVAIVYIWVVFALLSAKKIKKYAALAVSVLLGIPVSVIINAIVDGIVGNSSFDVWDVFSNVIIGAVAAAVFAWGYSNKVRTGK